MLSEFPYVNGGLFKYENIEIPNFNEETLDILLNKASAGFDWSQISPTIFGALFESTLNPETRRSGGMHFTSIENIHKVIDPLFLDELREEYSEIKQTKSIKTRNQKFDVFQDKLKDITFFDPACGSGNFLTETYLSLRRLENELLAEKQQNGQISFDTEIIKVSIGQFYGIEINDFAVTVAKTSLWIAESQMMKETEEIVNANLDFLPLKSYANIVEGNALRMDWESVVPKEKLDYIMGNPPFVGYSLQSESQKSDILNLFVDENGKVYKAAGKIDYVSGWYWKAAQLIQNTNIKCALVSTNSITQGEQVAALWKTIFERFNIHFDFAYRTFRWDSESTQKAHVHCVIIGFSSNSHSELDSESPKFIIDEDGTKIEVKNINGYLLDADNVWIDSRSKPLCSVPEMISGGKPVEGGFLIFTESEKQEFVNQEPDSEKYFRHFISSDDYINNHWRWCLWLVDCSPKEMRAMPKVMERVEKVKEFRLSSVKEATRKYAEIPYQFMEIKQPDSDYLLIPATSSENRRYIPIGFVEKNVIANNAASFVPNASLYHFGILTSSVHMAWMRAVCGRLEMRYRYSNTIVYNNFPWPFSEKQTDLFAPNGTHQKAKNVSSEQIRLLKTKIEQTAQKILDARAKYPDSSLADLYDETVMPPELRKAHQENDRAVMTAYGFNPKMTESEIVAELFKMYEKLAEGE